MVFTDPRALALAKRLGLTHRPQQSPFRGAAAAGGQQRQVDVGRTNARKAGAIECIRKFCLGCMGQSPSLVADCREQDCPLHALRMGRRGQPTDRPPIRAIRRQCLHCCCCDRSMVRACPASPSSRAPFEPCPLWRFRLGCRPEIIERRIRKARRTSLTLPGLGPTHRPKVSAG